jgi:tetratricopeptide (TPR) repeat protein
MSTTLNLVDRLLAHAQQLRALGRTHDARSLFERLAGFAELPAPVAQETQVRLAELDLGSRRFRRARRHLTAALQHRPDNARSHALMARAFSHGPDADLQRAFDHYRRSLELSPDQPRRLCAGGRLALRLGRREEGLAWLRRAVELAPDDPKTLRRATTGLRQAHCADEARAALLAARLRNPRDSRFRQLWDESQFQQLRREQELARLAARPDGNEEPVLLPFLHLTAEPASAGGESKVVRHDAPAPLPAPHGTGTPRLPQRHAQ